MTSSMVNESSDVGEPVVHGTTDVITEVTSSVK